MRVPGASQALHKALGFLRFHGTLHGAADAAVGSARPAAAAAATAAVVASAARDTIFALSSGAVRSAVAVVRISGPAVDAVLQQLMPQAAALPQPRVATLTSLMATDGGLLDRALVLRLPGPRSFTGEDCAELHCHGSPAVVRAVQDTLAALQLRPAKAGEFSRRAFDAGKLDLTQVEGLADLLAAETESQRRQALLHTTGAVRRQHEQWRHMLLTCLTRLEAVIDFGEDEEIADDVAAGVLPLVQHLRHELQAHLAAADGGELVRTGVRICIVGPPNAGKSSLLNLLAGSEAAIVSHLAGTTRDPVSVQLELGGIKVILTDSAGLRRTDCPIESEGVRRALAAAQRAHIVLHVADAASGAGKQQKDEGTPVLPLSEHTVHMQVLNKADLLGPAAAESARLAAAAAAAAGVAQQPVLPAMVRAAVQRAAAATGRAAGAAGDVHVISCQSGQGIQKLVASLQAQVAALVGHQGDALLTRARHRHHVTEAVAAMRRYEDAVAQIELACEELRAAAGALGRVVGAINTEQILDSLFSEFCIGK